MVNTPAEEPAKTERRKRVYTSMHEHKNAPEAHEGPAEKHHGHEHHHHHHDVEIKINGKHYKLHEGETSVKHLKQLAGIPLADALARVIDKHLHPLPDDGEVCIKQGEVFVSHPRESSSS